MGNSLMFCDALQWWMFASAEDFLVWSIATVVLVMLWYISCRALWGSRTLSTFTLMKSPSVLCDSRAFSKLYITPVLCSGDVYVLLTPHKPSTLTDKWHGETHFSNHTHGRTHVNNSPKTVQVKVKTVATNEFFMSIRYITAVTWLCSDMPCFCFKERIWWCNLLSQFFSKRVCVCRFWSQKYIFTACVCRFSGQKYFLNLCILHLPWLRYIKYRFEINFPPHVCC